MTGQEIIDRLAAEGIRLFLSGDRVAYRYEGEGEPDKERVPPLLNALRMNKAEVIKLLEASRVKPKPYLDAEGDLVIPHNSDPRYWWWSGGQTVSDTIRKLTQATL